MRTLRLAAAVHPAYAAAFFAFAADAVYLTVIVRQESGIGSRVVFVAASLAMAGVAAGAAEGTGTRAAGLAAAWAVATLWIWTLLGALSIGIAVVPAAIFATVALTRRKTPELLVAAGIAVALLTAVAGLVWT